MFSDSFKCLCATMLEFKFLVYFYMKVKLGCASYSKLVLRRVMFFIRTDGRCLLCVLANVLTLWCLLENFQIVAQDNCLKETIRLLFGGEGKRR